MKTYLFKLIVLIAFTMTINGYSQNFVLQLKRDFDLRLEVSDAHFVSKDKLSDQKFILAKLTENIPCEEDLYLLLKITNLGRKDVFGVTLTGTHFVNGQKQSDLSMNSIIEEKQVKKYVKYNGEVKAGESVLLVVVVPFAMSLPKELQKVNTYKFATTGTYQYRKVFGNNVITGTVKDPISSNSKTEISFWKECKRDEFLFDGVYIETYYETSKPDEFLGEITDKVVVKAYPNPVLFGNKLSFEINSRIPNPRSVRYSVYRIGPFGYRDPVRNSSISPAYKSGVIEFFTSDFLVPGNYVFTFQYPGLKSQVIKIIIEK